ncbi:MAG: hypothetical protein K0Q63_3680 [Paenibacillus sp.]|nr:hypothetical protein [Paenibacillus sp.]
MYLLYYPPASGKSEIGIANELIAILYKMKIPRRRCPNSGGRCEVYKQENFLNKHITKLQEKGMNGMDRLFVSEEDMVLETEEFAYVYPILMNEIEHIEKLRGKLNDFQLMLAVSRAKDSMGIVSWERRQTVNAILEKYAHLYRERGREEADEWVWVTFGFSLAPSHRHNVKDATAEGSGPETASENAAGLQEETEAAMNDEPESLEIDMQEIAGLIAVKEAELLQLYREFYRLSKGNS